MEEMLQQDKQESEYKDPNEDQGGIRRRLRDRDLLRKRKAEAEEKETNQVESPKKRSRAENKSGTKKRGRPRKTEATPQITADQEEATAPQEDPAVAVVPEPAEVIPYQIGSLFAAEPEPSSVLAGPPLVPEVESVQSFVSAPTLTSPAPADTTLDSTLPVQDSTPVLASAPAPAPAPALLQESFPAVAPAPPQVETLYIQSQDKQALDQVLIEDVGPDEEEDMAQTQDKPAAEDLSETLSINIPEQRMMYSVPTLSSQEYLPGNSL
ncbi:uncharacterized protein hemgn isoform 2-T2 [Pholidichthys leucotaenia]